jgi:hypothetical protein
MQGFLKVSSPVRRPRNPGGYSAVVSVASRRYHCTPDNGQYVALNQRIMLSAGRRVDELLTSWALSVTEISRSASNHYPCNNSKSSW